MAGSSASESSLLTLRKTFEMVERYGKAAANSRIVCEHIAELLDRDQFTFGTVNREMEKVYDRMKSCASWLTFREYVEFDRTILRSAKFCSKALLCQPCAIRRGVASLVAYIPKIELVLEKNKKLKPWMITITVKNGASLDERYKHLEKNLGRLLDRRKGWLLGKDGYSFTEMGKVDGAVFAFEAPKSPVNETWHPHIHMLALCETKPLAGFVDPETGKGSGLRKEWFDLTGDSFQVDVRRNKKKSTIIEMCCEVMKYAVKFSDQEPEDTYKAFRVLNRKRLLRSFGSLNGVKIPSSMVDAPLSGGYIDRIYSYLGGGNYEQIAEIDCCESYSKACQL